MKQIIKALLLSVLLCATAHAQYFGDIVTGTTHDFKFTTRTTTGAPTTLAGSPVVKCYKDNATGTEVTTGVTLSVDFDSVTGLNNLRVDASDAFYAAGSNIACLITTGTVSGTSVVGEVVAQFSIRDRSDQVAANDALIAQNLNQLLKVAVGTNFQTAVHANSVIGYLADISATSAYDRTTMSAEGAYANAPTVADIRTEIDSNSTKLASLVSASIVRSNTAQAGTGTTITLDSGASASNTTYIKHHILIVSGTGAGQGRQILSYVGSTKVATVDIAWATNPNSSSVFVIIP